jgi:transposase
MTYSVDFRKKVFEVKKEQGLTYEATAALFNIGKTTLVRWHNNIMPSQNRAPYSRTICREALKQDIVDYPDSYQYERAARLGCSRTGIQHALKSLSITRKKKLSRIQKLITIKESLSQTK